MTKKIFFYTHGLVDGGGERLWSCLASAFKTRGNDVTFVQDFEADENRANIDPALPVVTLGRGHIGAVMRLASLLKRERPDIVLAGIGGSNLKLMLARWLARSSCKTIITYHGFQEWKTGLLSLFTYLFLPVLSAQADATVAVSDGLRDELVRRWGAHARKTETILNPVFFPKSARVPSAAELRARPEILLAVGRMVPLKDFITLVRAFARLERPQARLVILGKGPEEVRIKAEIARLGIADRVTLPGYSKEPWGYYEKAKCFVSSSISEPFGNVIVEALAHGLPVVATACSGPQEILRHGEFGRIVALGSDLQLSHAMESALDNPGDPAIRRRRADEFSFDVRVPAYERLVARVLAGPSGEVVTTDELRGRTRPAA